MNVGNTVMSSNIVMLAIVALLIVAGLAASLIAITLRNIGESNGRTPQWPVSWPEPPVNLPQQQLDVSQQDVSQHDVSQQGVSQHGDSAEKVDVPRPRASLPQSGANRRR